MSHPDNLIWYSFPFTQGLRRMGCTEMAAGCAAIVVVPPSMQALLRDLMRQEAGQ